MITVAAGGELVRVPLVVASTVYGQYRPDSTTTGPARTNANLIPYPATGGPAGDVVNGDLIITKNNTRIAGFDLACRVVIRASGVELDTNRIRGNPRLANNSAVVDCNSALVAGAHIVDNLLVPDYPSIWCDAVIGHDYVAERNDAHHVVDGFGIYNNTGTKEFANVELYGNYVHDLSYFSPDPNHPLDSTMSMTHNDDVQIQGGRKIVVIGNHLSAWCATDTLSRDGSATADILRDSAHPNSLGGFNKLYPNRQANANLMLKALVAPVSDLIFDQNWCYGGGVAMHLDDTIGGVSHISGNRFGRDQRVATITGGGAAVMAASSGNVYEDTGAAVSWLA